MDVNWLSRCGSNLHFFLMTNDVEYFSFVLISHLCIWRNVYSTPLPIFNCISSVQLLSHVRLFVTPWTAAHQTSLSITNSCSLPKPMSIESVMPSNHLILCHPLLLLPLIFPSIRVFSNESALHIRWPKYWSFSYSISPSSEHPGLISYRMDWLDLLAVQGTLKSLWMEDSFYLPGTQCKVIVPWESPCAMGWGSSPGETRLIPYMFLCLHQLEMSALAPWHTSLSSSLKELCFPKSTQPSASGDTNSDHGCENEPGLPICNPIPLAINMDPKIDVRCSSDHRNLREYLLRSSWCSHRKRPPSPFPLAVVVFQCYVQT